MFYFVEEHIWNCDGNAFGMNWERNECGGNHLKLKWTLRHISIVMRSEYVGNVFEMC